MRLRHVIGAAMLAIPGTSCSLGEPTEASSLNVYVEVDKVTLLREDLMTITVTARNVGYDPLTLTGPSDCLLYVQVIHPNGQTVWNSSTTGGCVGNTVVETLNPGMDKVQSLQWNGVGSQGVRVDPGTYVVRPVARLASQAYFGPGLSIVVE